MMNKKLIALLVTVTTISATTFAFLDDVWRGTTRVAESAVEAPADVATGGRTWEERHDRWQENDDIRNERRRERYQERRDPRDAREYRDRYYD